MRRFCSFVSRTLFTPPRIIFATFRTWRMHRRRSSATCTFPAYLPNAFTRAGHRTRVPAFTRSSLILGPRSDERAEAARRDVRKEQRLGVPRALGVQQVPGDEARDPEVVLGHAYADEFCLAPRRRTRRTPPRALAPVSVRRSSSSEISHTQSRRDYISVGVRSTIGEGSQFVGSRDTVSVSCRERVPVVVSEQSPTRHRFYVYQRPAQLGLVAHLFL